MAHFSFLPPLAQATINGEFNPYLKPAVVICHLNAVSACDTTLARFETKTGEITVSLSNEQYQVNWQISGIQEGQWYRIGVYSGPWANAPLLGAIDLQGASGGGFVSPNSGSPNIQSTLPIKFRIEYGILCTTLAADSGTQPCVVMAVGPDGGTVVNEDSTAGAYFPPGALDQWVNVTIERYEPGDPDDSYNTVCLPTNDPQYGMCFRFKTDPDLPNFQPVNGDSLSVTVGVCPEASVFQDPSLFGQLDLYKWDEVDPASLTYLPPKSVTFLNCPGSPYYTAPSGFAFSRVPQPFRGLLQLLAPTPVLAGSTSPYGGTLKDFSRIGWVRKLSLQKVSGDAQQEYLGLAVPIDPTVRVIAGGARVTSVIPVSGVPIQFAASPDGSASPSSALTDTNGYASTVWTLGTTAGQNSLTVTATNPLAPTTDVFPNQAGVWGTVVFSATAVTPPPPPPPAQYRVVFLQPIAKGRLNKTDVNVPGVPVFVKICSIDVTTWPCEYARRIVDSGSYRFQWKADATDPVGRYKFSVYDNTTSTPVLLDSFVGAVAKDGSALPKGTDFGFQLGSTIPIKFLLIAK